MVAVKMSNLDFLSVWHRTVALHLQSVLDGVEELRLEPVEIGDPGRCELGQWLAAQGASLARMPAYDELLVRHRHYHQVARRLVGAPRTGLARGLNLGALAELQAASEAVTLAIDRLIEQLQFGAEAFRARPTDFWDDSLRIGIDLIDEQHKAIAELGARVARAPEMSLSSESGVDFLGSFYKLIAFHFETEEQLMARICAPGDWQRAHIREHSALLETIVSYSYEQTLGTGPARIAEIVQDLQRIIVDHVIDFDFGFKVCDNALKRPCGGRASAG